MPARVSSHHAVDVAIAQLHKQTTVLGELQNQIGSGSRLSRPSLGPSAYVEVQTRRSGSLRFDMYRESIADMTGTLNESVSALQEAHNLLTRASAIASEGANAATDSLGHAALAIEVDEIIERMIATSNTQMGDRFLFGGAATSGAPFKVTATDPAGRPTEITYVGSTERGRGIPAAGQTVDTFYAGNQVFQSARASVFGELMGLRDELRDPSLNDAQRSDALSQRLGTLQSARDVVLDTVGEQAASLETMQAMTNRFGDLQLALDTRVADLDGVDVSEVVVRIGEYENLLKATIGVTSRLIDGSFLDFLR